MSKKDNDIAAAMKALQVNKPLRVLSKAPHFTPPSLPEPEQTWNEKGTQDQKGTWDEKSTQVANQTQDDSFFKERLTLQEHCRKSGNSPSLEKTQDAIQTWDENGTQDEKSTQVAYSPQDSLSQKWLPRKSQPKKATTQDVAVLGLLEFRDKLTSGYCRIPNSVLMRLISGEFNATEIKVALLIGRMTVGFKNKKYASLSKKVFETLTNAQGPAILQALQKLEKAQVIEKIAGDQFNPNQFRLIFDETVFGSDPSPQKPSEDRTQGEKSTQDVKSTEVSETTQDAKNTHYIDNIIYKYSLSSIYIYICNYLSTLRPLAKRESELRHFETLLKEFSAEEITLSLKYLLAKGLPQSGIACHSPMAYLSRAMVQVLLQAKQIERVEPKSSVPKNSAPEPSREELAMQRYEEEFQLEFPTAELQQAYIASFASRHPNMKLGNLSTRYRAIEFWGLDSQKSKSVSA